VCHLCSSWYSERLSVELVGDLNKCNEACISTMKIHKYPGFFIDIEGLDGSGSQTQVGLLAARLKKEGRKFLETREPSAGPVGRLVHQLLKVEKDFPPAVTQLLFAADRGLHLHREITPVLEKGGLVMTNRYLWSTIAFGSVELSRQWLADINNDYYFPDLTIFIEVSPDMCLDRVAKEKSGVELLEKEDELARAWATYHSLASKYWWTGIRIIDGERPKEAVAEEIWGCVSKHHKFG
jgi:dTMP kinase